MCRLSAYGRVARQSLAVNMEKIHFSWFQAYLLSLRYVWSVFQIAVSDLAARGASAEVTVPVRPSIAVCGLSPIKAAARPGWAGPGWASLRNHPSASTRAVFRTDASQTRAFCRSLLCSFRGGWRRRCPGCGCSCLVARPPLLGVPAGSTGQLCFVLSLCPFHGLVLFGLSLVTRG